MKELLLELLYAVITVVIPIISTYTISAIKKTGENAAADTGYIKMQGYINEITDAVTNAVAATSQTYVDALKRAGTFDKQAQKEAAQRALAACCSSITPAATEFIESAYGDVKAYLMNKIEAEVRKQKNEAPAYIALEAEECTSDTTAVAASTAAATAASYLQTAINQLDAEAGKKAEQPEQ